MNKTLLYITYNSLLTANACKDGIERLLKVYPELKDNPDQKLNLKKALKSNTTEDVIWALRATTEDSRTVSVEIANRAAARAKEYSDAYYAANAAAADAAYYANAAASSWDVADAAWAAARAAWAAARAAASSWAAADAAWAAARDADAAARAAEKEKQKEDLIELLDGRYQ